MIPLLLTIILTPRSGIAPATIEATAWVGEFKQEQVVCLQSDDLRGQDCWDVPHEGGVYTKTWQDVPAGEYIVTALLTRTIGEREQNVKVVIKKTKAQQ